jgi:hypothetical protein
MARASAFLLKWGGKRQGLFSGECKGEGRNGMKDRPLGITGLQVSEHRFGTRAMEGSRGRKFFTPEERRRLENVDREKVHAFLRGAC